MALSNIFKEPRRELTESAVGIGVILVAAVPLGWLDYQLALSTSTPAKPEDFWLVLFLLGPFLIFVVSALVLAFFAVTHALGNAICNGLEKRGIQLRPKQRYL